MLEEELASAKQELANYKKMVYGQKSEKSEIILARQQRRRQGRGALQ